MPSIRVTMPISTNPQSVTRESNHNILESITHDLVLLTISNMYDERSLQGHENQNCTHHTTSRHITTSNSQTLKTCSVKSNIHSTHTPSTAPHYLKTPARANRQWRKSTHKAHDAEKSYARNARKKEQTQTCLAQTTKTLGVARTSSKVKD